MLAWLCALKEVQLVQKLGLTKSWPSGNCKNLIYVCTLHCFWLSKIKKTTLILGNRHVGSGLIDKEELDPPFGLLFLWFIIHFPSKALSFRCVIPAEPESIFILLRQIQEVTVKLHISACSSFPFFQPTEWIPPCVQPWRPWRLVPRRLFVFVKSAH